MPTKNVATSKKRVFGRSDYKHELEESRDKKEHNPYIPTFLGMGLAVICFMLLFVGIGVASATDYYVATWGSDSNLGTEAQPWGTIQKAANTLIAGDIVYIKEGTYNEKVIPKNSGSPGNYITYTSYPDHIVTIDGTGIPTYPKGLFHIENKSYIKVSGLRIENYLGRGSCFGIYIYNGCDHIITENNYITNTDGCGIFVYGKDTQCSNIIIDNNEVSYTNLGDWDQEAISLFNVNTFEVKNNHVHNVDRIGIDAKDGSSNGIIYNNHVHDSPSRSGIYTDAGYGYEHNIDVYNNLVHDVGGNCYQAATEGPEGVLENIRFFNNIGYNCGSRGFVIYNLPGLKRNIKVINNVFYNSGTYSMMCTATDAENVVFRNNLCSGGGIKTSGMLGITIDHNLFDGESLVYGDNPVICDPKFVNPATGDFHLQSGSPAIDAGSSADAPSDDFNGNPRPLGAGYDIGAYEYVEATPTPTATPSPTPTAIPSPTPNAGTISGTVTDENSSLPISGAKVTADGYFVTTNTTGGYTISLPAGNYTVTVSKTGYLPESQENVEVLEKQTTTVNFQLTETPDLVGEWRFEEGSGIIASDSSEYGNNGILVNGPAWVDGKVGKALNFDGVDDYVDCGNDASLDITDEITIMAWVYPTASSYDQWDAILGKGNGAYRLHMHDNQFDFGLSIVELPNQNLDAGSVFAQNHWAHVAATYNGTNMKIYINGALANSTAVSGAIKTNNYHLWIGGRSEDPKYFKGAIDEVKIYNRALSAEEIREDYEVGLENTTPPASISNLQNITGTTWINWTWTNPTDDDFNYTMVYLNGAWQTNTSFNYYNATGLIVNTSYEIGTHTGDINGNVNTTWVNQTAKTEVVSDETPPLVTNPTATPSTILLNDNSRPRAPGTNISQLNVTVTDDTEVDTVTIGLSPIGGPSEAQMSKIPGTDIWSVTTNATAGINLTHNLIVTATDVYGNSNTSVSIQLTVLRRGDVFRDNVVDTKDAAYIARYLAGSEHEVPNLLLVGDVVGENGDPTGDGVVDMKDAAYIARYEAGFEDVP